MTTKTTKTTPIGKTRKALRKALSEKGWYGASGMVEKMTDGNLSNLNGARFEIFSSRIYIHGGSRYYTEILKEGFRINGGQFDTWAELIEKPE